MKELKKSLPTRQQAGKFTLFLDRDGVINEPIIDDYARKPKDLVLIEGMVEAITELKRMFRKVYIVTNQQGVGRGLMTEHDLEDIHLKMYNALKGSGVILDGIFFAPYLKTENHHWRKPQNGMLMKAKSYDENINWEQSIVVGDSPRDMQLADTLGLIKVRISNSQFDFDNQHFHFNSLQEFVDCLS